MLFVNHCFVCENIVVAHSFSDLVRIRAHVTIGVYGYMLVTTILAVFCRLP